MNPQNDHYLFELKHHHLHKPELSQHHLPEVSNVRTSRKEKVRNNLQFISRLRRIRIQIVFEVAEPRPDGC